MTQPNHHFGSNKPWKLTNLYSRKSNEISYDNDIELSGPGCASDLPVPNTSAVAPPGLSSGIFPQLQQQQQHQQRISIVPSSTQQIPNTSANSNEYSNQAQHDQQPQINKNNNQNSTNQKFSIFSKLNNVHKLNAFDNLLIAATSTSILEDGEDLTEEKKTNTQKLMEQSISDEAKQQITFILEKISLLKPAEKLLLYLKMPGGFPETDPLKQSQNPLGSRSEINHTINWVRSHLEHDPNVSIPKQEVYEDYIGYCARIGIKPLSTADFGKVMKQVFPDIRPRRLGTRGHSRYCYAAMRKATKLDPPKLPDISNKSDPILNEMEKEEKAWKVIKSWSENLLSTQFPSAAELADHITKNNLNSPVSSTSRQILQKKLLQREIKERKKLNNQALKKRRKKRKKTSSTSSDPPAGNEETAYDENIEIKKELEDLDDDTMENLEEQSDNSGEMMQPMNLTNPTEQQQSQQTSSVENQGTNLIASCDKTSGSTAPDQPQEFSHLDENIKIRLKNKIASNSAEMSGEAGRDDVENQIFCKKVRQAQQAKANAMLHDVKELPLQKGDPEYPTQMLMPAKIPAKRKMRKEVSFFLKRIRSQQNLLKMENPGNPSPLNQVEPADLLFKKDDLTQEILPRERFDSICNMDKNALDSYLNLNEENSQDPELCQYFGDDKTGDDEDEELEAPMPLETCPMFQGEKTNDKISQLRTMLEQNIQGSPHFQGSSSGNSGSPLVGNSLDNSIKTLLLNKSPLQSGNPSTGTNVSSNPDQLPVYPGSASASLAIMSQRHHNIPPNLNQSQMKFYPNIVQPTAQNLPQNVPHSPNTRRKNMNFVPIPQNAGQKAPNSKVKNINMNPAFQTGDLNPMSPFVSPRNTPNLKRSKSSHPNLPALNIHENKMVPLLGTSCDTSFSRPQQFKMEPVSAPPSPSMITTCRFGSQQNNSNFHFTPLNNNPPVSYPVESRSQSVPPHCTNPYNFNGYSSACSSVAPTPAPSEYADFNDTNILDIFNNEQPPPIKMEADSDLLTDLLENDNLGQGSSGEAEIMGLADPPARNNFANASRSVPTTPLPYHPYNSNNNFCNLNNNNNNNIPVGKSVPTTPIGTYNPFRYSPDLQRTRDFLINGFNVNNNNNNNNINVNDKNIKSAMNNGQVGSTGFPEMDDIPSFDTTMLNNL